MFARSSCEGREQPAAAGVLVDWRRASRSPCDGGQLILMALRLLSRPAVLHVTTSVRHGSEASSCGPEESSEPRCIAKTSACKTLANSSLSFALAWQHARVRNRFDSVSSRALKPANGCRSRWVAPDAARALLPPLVSLALAHAVAHAVVSTRARDANT